MLKNIMAAMLMHFWNYILSFQTPVVYSRTETNNNHNFRVNHGIITHIFEVKQVLIRRQTKFAFLINSKYQYEVTQYVFNADDLVHRTTQNMPELCFMLFRITKVPHLLAVNAFLEINKEGD